MKNYLLSALIGLLAFSSSAATYNYLEFKSNDGSSQFISTEGLVINIDGSNLLVADSEGNSLTLDANNLVSMQFTNNDDTNAVKEILVDNGDWKVYNVEGLYSGKYYSIREAQSTLPNGVYVLKNSQGKSIKIVVSR